MAWNETGCEWHSVTVDNEGHDLRLSLTIKNFLEHASEPGQKLETTTMKCTERCGVKWTLQVYLHGTREEKRDDVGVYLKLVEKPSHAEVVTASYQLYVLDRNGNKTKVFTCNQVEDHLRRGCGTSRLITRSEIASNKDMYLHNGCLTIQCSGKEFLNEPNQTLKIQTIPRIIPSNPSLGVLRKMYEGSICCDVVLKSGDSEFKCHKGVLATSSSYFKTLFEHDTKDSSENVLDLSEYLKEEELRAILDYIYLGTREFPSLNADSYQSLFRICDIYEIEGLQKVCEFSLIGQLNLDNARDILNFAAEYGAKGLEKAAATVIANGPD